MKCLLVVFLALCCALYLPRCQSAPQRSIDFLLGDEEQQAVVKPIAAESVPTEGRPTALEDEREELPEEVQATVDPIENEVSKTEAPAEEARTEDYPEEEQSTDDPQEQVPLDPVTESPNAAGHDEQSTSPAPSVTTPSPATPSTSSPASDSPSSTTESDENTSSEEQLTTNPIVVAENDDQTTTESSEDSNQLAQDVNDFIHDLVNEVRTGATDQPQQSQNSSDLPPMVADDSKSLESNEDDDQVQLKVDPNGGQPSNGPSFTEDQFRALLEKLPWFGQQRFPGGYDQWQHQAFPQRSSWQHRDDRQRLYQGGVDGFQSHGFHRSSWH